MNRVCKGLAGLAVIVNSALVGGCLTASHNAEDLHRVNQRAFSSGAKTINVSDLSFEKPSRPADYEGASAISRTYGNIPQQKLNVYFVDGEYKEKVVVDTTGPFDRETVYGINRLEGSIPEGGQRTRFDIGAADNNFVSYSASQNQMSDDCGLKTVDSYGTNNFTITINEVTGLNRKLNETRNYTVGVKFGEKDFMATKRRTDGVFVLNVAEDALIVSALAGWPSGAAWGGADLIDAGCGWAEGSRLNSEAFMSDSRSFAGGLEGVAADVSSTLEHAKTVGASDLIVVKYDSGTGVVYANGLDGVSGLGNGIVFETGSVGANELAKLFLKCFKFLPAAGIGGGKTKYGEGNDCNGGSGGVIGGQTGGPGGNGPGISGGSFGGVGGN